MNQLNESAQALIAQSQAIISNLMIQADEIQKSIERQQALVNALTPLLSSDSTPVDGGTSGGA